MKIQAGFLKKIAGTKKKIILNLYPNYNYLFKDKLSNDIPVNYTEHEASIFLMDDKVGKKITAKNYKINSKKQIVEIVEEKRDRKITYKAQNGKGVPTDKEMSFILIKNGINEIVVIGGSKAIIFVKEGETAKTKLPDSFSYTAFVSFFKEDPSKKKRYWNFISDDGYELSVKGINSIVQIKSGVGNYYGLISIIKSRKTSITEFKSREKIKGVTLKDAYYLQNDTHNIKPKKSIYIASQPIFKRVSGKNFFKRICN